MRSRLPAHVGFIPDGNRRWAQERGLPKQAGYDAGIAPGLDLLSRCAAAGIDEVSIYGFTQDNTRRPAEQKQAFTAACVNYALAAESSGAALLVVGDASSPLFPPQLKRFTTRQGSGIRVNLLCNYGWEWDLGGLRRGGIHSAAVPRLDMVVRWGGGRRLSGFLPVQSVYADFFVVDDYWPDYQPEHFDAALDWYRVQDRTLGG